MYIEKQDSQLVICWDLEIFMVMIDLDKQNELSLPHLHARHSERGRGHVLGEQEREQHRTSEARQESGIGKNMLRNKTH